MGSYQPKHKFVAILTSDQTDLGKKISKGEDLTTQW